MKTILILLLLIQTDFISDKYEYAKRMIVLPEVVIYATPITVWKKIESRIYTL